MQAGNRVRLKTAPDRVGVLTGETKLIAGKTRWKVDFQTRQDWYPQGNLELVKTTSDPFDLWERGSYGGVRNLRALITHARLTGRLADVIYSMEATNTEFFPYQFKPVLNFLDSPSRGVLIADEVGLGKTIEAGLIWTELRARFDARRLLVVCPAMLREKWEDELSLRFGVKARICGATDVLRILQQQEKGGRDGFAMVASIQGLRPTKNWDDDEKAPAQGVAALARYLRAHESDEPLFDCVIVDEAHYLRNPETKTHELGRLLREVTDNLVLLSATPIQLRSDDLFHLLNLIDADSFQYQSSFQDVLMANAPLIKLASLLRRGPLTSAQLGEALEWYEIFPQLTENRVLRRLRETPPSEAQLADVRYRVELADSLERMNLLASVVTRSRKVHVQENKVVRDPKAPVIEMYPIERELYAYVTETVRRYCHQHDLAEGFLLTTPQRQLSSSVPAALRAWGLDALIEDEAALYEMGYPEALAERAKPVAPLVRELTAHLARYPRLKAAFEVDSKFDALTRLLDEYWRRYPDNKVILFSYFRETLNYLSERFRARGVGAGVLMGGASVSKQDVIDRFRESGDQRILLCSEVASEGVDLQFCSLLVNYDLPWNPMRVEQRIGRIDRIGQRAERIQIWNLFYADTIDDRVYRRLYERLDVFRYALGDIEAVLGEQIRDLTFELLSHDLTPEQEEIRIAATEAAVATMLQQQESLESEAAKLMAHGDYIMNRVNAARELRRYIRGDDLWAYTRDFFQENYPGCGFSRKQDTPLIGEVMLSDTARQEIAQFLQANRHLERTGIANAPQSTLLCFDNKFDVAKSKLERVSQYHPLIRFISKRIDQHSFHPLVAARVSVVDAGSLATGIYVCLVKRWSSKGARNIERVVYRAGRLGGAEGDRVDDQDAERLVNLVQATGTDWLEANAQVDQGRANEVFHALNDAVDEEFESYAEQLRLENEDRIDFQIQAVRKHLQGQIDAIEATNRRLAEQGKNKIIKANQGRVEKLRARLSDRVSHFEGQRLLNSEYSYIVSGVVYVGEGASA